MNQFRGEAAVGLRYREVQCRRVEDDKGGVTVGALVFADGCCTFRPVRNLPAANILGGENVLELIQATMERLKNVSSVGQVLDLVGSDFRIGQDQYFDNVASEVAERWLCGFLERVPETPDDRGAPPGTGVLASSIKASGLTLGDLRTRLVNSHGRLSIGERCVVCHRRNPDVGWHFVWESPLRSVGAELSLWCASCMPRKFRERDGFVQGDQTIGSVGEYGIAGGTTFDPASQRVIELAVEAATDRERRRLRDLRESAWTSWEA